jgi:competence protein ComGC
MENRPSDRSNAAIDRQLGRGIRGAAGFVLGEFLIVIFVFGALVAIVEFATSGVASQTADAVCRSDATTVETAIAFYNIQTGGTPTVTAALLTSGAPPYLKSFPSNPYFSISIASGVEMIAVPRNASPVAYESANVCASLASLQAVPLTTTTTVAPGLARVAPTTTTISSR